MMTRLGRLVRRGVALISRIDPRLTALLGVIAFLAAITAASRFVPFPVVVLAAFTALLVTRRHRTPDSSQKLTIPLDTLDNDTYTYKESDESGASNEHQ